MLARKILAVLILSSLVLAATGCRPGTATPEPALTGATAVPVSLPSSTVAPAVTIQPTVTLQPVATKMPLPQISLGKGENYFSIEGRPAFIYGRNITGITPDDFGTMLKWARSGGTKILRLHLTFGWWGTPWAKGDGKVNPDWFTVWDKFFDEAESAGMYIMPVFGVWADWNSGQPDLGGALWQYNPLNPANGGIFSDPTQLFVPDSKLQTAWMDWLAEDVRHWQGRDNIAGWEIFSEVNIATGVAGDANQIGGVSEPGGADFINRAAAVVRRADQKDRPVTASVAGLFDAGDAWNDFYDLDSLDFIEIHPYTESLDYELINLVGRYLARYKKPVMIGEAGLSAYLTAENIPPGTDLALRHAMWAGLVSGAMNGRSLWAEDGYAVYWDANDRTKSWNYMQRLIDLERPAVDFVEGVDFTGYRPLPVQLPSDTKAWGAAVGNEKSAIGWFRDAYCIPPNWPLAGVISGQAVLVTVPGKAASWQVDFYSTTKGTDLIQSISVTRQGDKISLPLPDFKDDIAFKMYAK
jgi:hypothetical protein